MRMSADAAYGWRALFARPYGGYLATFSLGSALYAFSAFLVSACMPSTVLALGHLALISWGFTFYLIAAIVAGTLASPMKWRLGTANALQCAGLAYLAGSLACGLAPNIWTLLGGRVLQGLGEGAVSGLSYILIPEVFPPLLIPAIFGVEATIWAAGSLSGPILGGFLTQAISWRAAFLVEVPPILLFMLLVWITIPRAKKRMEVHQPLPVLRVLGLGCAILLLSVAAIETALWMRIGSILIALALLVVVTGSDLRASNRLLPVGAFSLRSSLGLAFWVVLLMPAAHTGPGTYIILLLEEVWGYDPLTASILGAAMVAAWSGVGIAVSRLPPRRARACLWLGPLMLALGLLLDGPAMAMQSLSLLLVGQACVGVGYGLSWGFLSQAIMTGAAPGDRDRASAMLPTVLSTGLAIGAALGGVAANSAGLAEHASAEIVARAGLYCFLAAGAIGLVCFLISLRLRARTPVTTTV
jgi:MFS family permease